MMITTLYACSCCGSRTFAAPPPDTYLVCPVCYWEDLPRDQFWPIPYGQALHQAQRSFQRIGACDARYRNAVRPAAAHERPAQSWRAIDDTIERLDQELREVFAGVVRGDGITLHEADVIDNYGSDAQRLAARLLDMDQHWSELTDAVIEQFPHAISFLDAAGLHYYLPAYLSWALRNYDASDSPLMSWLLSSLMRNSSPTSDYQTIAHARFDQLTTHQAQLVCRVLRFLVRYGYGCIDVDKAQAAIDQYWGDVCHATDA